MIQRIKKFFADKRIEKLKRNLCKTIGHDWGNSGGRWSQRRHCVRCFVAIQVNIGGGWFDWPPKSFAA